jgi:hypothetical protein
MGDAAARERVAEVRRRFETAAGAQPVTRNRRALAQYRCISGVANSCMNARPELTCDKSSTHIEVNSRAVDGVGDWYNSPAMASLSCFSSCASQQDRCGYAEIQLHNVDSVLRWQRQGGVLGEVWAKTRDGRSVTCSIQFIMLRDGISTRTSYGCHLME